MAGEKEQDPLGRLLEIAKKRTGLWRNCTCDSPCCQIHREWNREIDEAVAACTGEEVKWSPF